MAGTEVKGLLPEIPGPGDLGRNEMISVEIIQKRADEEGETVLSRRVVVEYSNLLNAEANAMNFLLCDAVDKGLLDLMYILAATKAEKLGQTEVWEWYRKLVEERWGERG